MMKKRIWILGSLLVLAFGILAQAQKQLPEERKPVSQTLDFWVSETERLVVPAADAMPEANYSFAPTGGEFKGVRTFAEQVKHLAAANYQLGAGILGEIRHRVRGMRRRRRPFKRKRRLWNI